MNAPLTKVAIPSLAMSEPELIGVLKTSVYPGAEDASIKLVIGYCRAAHLDPLQKPVHIVPMDVRVGKDQNNKPIYDKRDVIMPGVGLYRVQAARTGEYAGMTEPEFGPDVEFEFEETKWGRDRREVTKKAKIVFPDWCKVTVRRVIGGVIVDFPAIEYWRENYATAGNWTDAPNKMWKKRPRGQIAKCAEAQALRKAFPEIGAQPTAEEMEGKTIDVSALNTGTAQIAGPQEKGAPGAQPAAAAPAAEVAKTDVSATTDAKLMPENKRRILKARLESAELTDAQVAAKFGKPFEQFLDAEFNDVQNWIRDMAEQRK